MKQFIITHLESAGITFVSTFLLVISLAISASTFTFTKESFIALISAGAVAATRAVFKIIYEMAKGMLTNNVQSTEVIDSIPTQGV